MKAAALAGHAFLGWAVCGAAIVLGRLAFSLHATLIVHAAVAPIVFALLSWHYFRRYPDSSPTRTAAAMLGIIVSMDAGVVAPAFEHSYAMFGSALGTWIPFALIALTIHLTGRTIKSRRSVQVRQTIRAE